MSKQIPSTQYLTEYDTLPSQETVKRLNHPVDPGNELADLERAGLDEEQRHKAFLYGIGHKADLGRSFSHEFINYLSELSYSVLSAWIKENAPPEIAALFEDVVILVGDVARFEGVEGLHDIYFSMLAETVADVSQIIPGIGGKFEEFTDY